MWMLVEYPTASPDSVGMLSTHPHTASRSLQYHKSPYYTYNIASQYCIYRVTQKKWELLKNSTKIEEIQEKKFIDRN